jgi:hypothetical protein
MLVNRLFAGSKVLRNTCATVQKGLCLMTDEQAKVFFKMSEQQVKNLETLGANIAAAHNAVVTAVKALRTRVDKTVQEHTEWVYALRALNQIKPPQYLNLPLSFFDPQPRQLDQTHRNSLVAEVPARVIQALTDHKRKV